MALRVKRAKNILGTTPKRSFQAIARSKLAVKDAKRTKAIKQIRVLFEKEKKRTAPARRTLADVREKKKRVKIDRSIQLKDARRSKRKKSHVLERKETRSTRKYKKPSLKTIATEKISLDKVKIRERALYLKNLLKMEKARQASIAKSQKKKKAKIQLILNLSIARAKKASYRSFQYPSSVVSSMGYDPSSLVMYVDWNEGGDGYYEGVPEIVYEGASGGDEWCRTNGFNAYGSWYVGKDPSVGAFMYWNVRSKYKYTRLS